MVSKLLKLMPPHDYYVEPFGGGASLLFAKPPAKVETYNDINRNLTDFFRVLKDKSKFEKFYQLVVGTPYSRIEYNEAREKFKIQNWKDDVEKAYYFFIVAKMSFSGRFGQGWSSAVTASHREMAATCSRWFSTVDMLPQIHERLSMVQIENSDWRNILQRYFGEEYLAYVDPPYVSSTRKSGKYEHEMTDADHRELVEYLLNYDGKVMLSGYSNELYKLLDDAGWVRYDFKTGCYAAGKTRATGLQGKGAAMQKQSRVESVWLNPQSNVFELKNEV